MHLTNTLRRRKRMNPYSGESSGSVAAACRISSVPWLPFISSSTSSREMYLIQNLLSAHTNHWLAQTVSRKLDSTFLLPLACALAAIPSFVRPLASSSQESDMLVMPTSCACVRARANGMEVNGFVLALLTILQALLEHPRMCPTTAMNPIPLTTSSH